MNAHRIRRLAEVLVASQVRSGRAGSDPRSFFGRGISLLVYDAVAFAVVFSLGTLAAETLGASAPGAVTAAATLLLPLMPALSLSVVLVAGVMLELTTTGRYASSDAANWLPLPPSEYVAASSLAIGYSYSLTAAVVIAAGFALAIPAGLWPVAALSTVLSVGALLEGGVIIEMIRATTQRVTGAVSGRTGRMAIFLRAAAALVLILLFELAVNPILLFDALRTARSLEAFAAWVPFLWGTESVALALSGGWALTAAFALGFAAVLAVLALLAGELRARFWVPISEEIRLQPVEYGGGHRVLSALGFGRTEASLVSKDLRGLTRRRDLTPMLVIPVVLAILGYFDIGGAGAGRYSGIFWVALVAGFFGLLLAVTSIGQERRSIENLYIAPVGWRSVFRAKFGTALLLTGTFGALFTVAISFRYGFGVPIALGTVAIAFAAAAEGTALGLAFASRFSDFQERPRPQYLRPAAMLTAMLLGTVLLSATIIPIAYWLAQPTLTGPVALVLGIGLFTTALTLSATVLAARSGVRSLMAELPF